MASTRPQLDKLWSGAAIYACAGALWAAYGGYWLRGAMRPWMALPPLAPALALGIVLLRLRARIRAASPATLTPADQQREARESRAFVVVNIAQGVAIFLAVQVCHNTGRPEYLPPVFAGIVGLHFLALAPALGVRMHWIIGTAMCALALFTVLALPRFLQPAGPTAAPVPLWGAVPGLGSAVVLWLGSALRLRAIARGLEPPAAML